MHRTEGKSNKVKERAMWGTVDAPSNSLYVDLFPWLLRVFLVGSLTCQPLRVASSAEKHLTKVTPLPRAAHIL